MIQYTIKQGKMLVPRLGSNNFMSHDQPVSMQHMQCGSGLLIAEMVTRKHGCTSSEVKITKRLMY